MTRTPVTTWSRARRAGWLIVALLLITPSATAQQPPPQLAPSKPATEATKAANAAVLQALPFGDKSDFQDAQRGLVGKPDTLTIRDAKGNDLNKQYALVVENGVLNYFTKPVSGADATIHVSKATLDDIQLKDKTMEQAIAAGDMKIDGKREAFTEFMGLLDAFPFWSNIVTP